MNKEQIVDLLITSADFVILTINGTGNVISANPAVRKVFGLQEGEIEGKKLADIIPDIELLEQVEFTPIEARGGMDSFDDHDVEICDCIYLEALAAKEELGDHHEIQILVGNDVRWIELATKKILHGDNLFFTVIINDITRRKNDEQKILDLNQSLEQKVLARTADLESRTNQVKKIVVSCGDELKAINDTYQSMKERQMDIIEEMEGEILESVDDLNDTQIAGIKQSVGKQLTKCMNIYSEDQITDQKFLLAIITLNELFEGNTIAQDNLKPGQLSGTSQEEVDDLLGSLGI
jgi:hypothetical protein